MWLVINSVRFNSIWRIFFATDMQCTPLLSVNCVVMRKTRSVFVGATIGRQLVSAIGYIFLQQTCNVCAKTCDRSILITPLQTDRILLVIIFMNRELPNRKPNRLKGFDYSKNGCYFITLCTKDRQNLLWCDTNNPQAYKLSPYGAIVDSAILDIHNHYPEAFVDKYVIMPNHIHLILRINCGNNTHLSHSVSKIIQQTKGYISKQIGFSIWQKLFHDHIIRNESEYQEIWTYIDRNPLTWSSDCFFY